MAAQAPSATALGPSRPQAGSPPRRPRGLGGFLREWVDPLIFAFLLAMFVRTFVVELFKIPSGSMTPTLIGDQVAEVDYDGDGDMDLIVASESRARAGRPRYQIFLRKGSGYQMDRPTPFVSSLPPLAADAFERKRHVRYDRICVSKFAYWFQPVQRGDIVVFKVPESIFTAEKPIYIKRVAGLPGETVAIREGRLWVNGAPATVPPFYRDHFYSNACDTAWFTERTLGPSEFLLFGDNTLSSLDSRAWGPVPAGNLRGKAFFRYMPLSHVGLIR